MGGISYQTIEPKSKRTILKTAEALKAHPNYKDIMPFEGESLVAFTLRCSAQLVSPPMYEGEDSEIECIDLAKTILTLEKEIIEKWENFTDQHYM